MEKMDEQILPAVSRFIGCSFRARPHELGNITFGRALVQALASPLGGIAGGLLGCCWAGCALLLGCCWAGVTPPSTSSIPMCRCTP